MRSSASDWRALSRPDRVCSSWRPRPARRSSSTPAPRHRPRGARAARALDEAVRSGMIEEVPCRRLAYRFTHELVRRALYDRLSGMRRAELHLRVGECPREQPADRSGRALADLAHHFAAAAPSAATPWRRLQRPCRPRGDEPRSPTTRRRHGSVPRSSADRRPGERAERLLDLGGACHRAGRALDALEAFTAAADIARELGNAELLARAAIGYEAASWRPEMHRPRRGRAAGGGGRRPRRRELRAAGAPARRPGPRARLPGATERGAIVRSNAAMARRLDDRGGLATVLARAYWSRGTTRSGRSSTCSPRPGTSARSSATPRSAPRRWRGARPRSSRSAISTPPAANCRAARDRGATAQPFMIHVAEQFGAAIALCDGRLRRRRDHRRALARGGPAAHRARRVGRLRDPDVRHPPRAGPPGGTRPVMRILAAGDGTTDHGGRASPRCSSSSAWRQRRARARADRRRGPGSVPRLPVVGSLSYSPTRGGARRRGDRDPGVSRARVPRRRPT